MHADFDRFHELYSQTSTQIEFNLLQHTSCILFVNRHHNMAVALSLEVCHGGEA